MPEEASAVVVAPPTDVTRPAANGRRVCMFVYNNCASDVRVLKEAESLRGAGYTVQIVAVLDKLTEPEEDRDGIRIVRIDRNPLHYKLLRLTRRSRARLRRWRGRLRLSRRRLAARLRRRRGRLRLARKRRAVSLRAHRSGRVLLNATPAAAVPARKLGRVLVAVIALAAAPVALLLRAVRWRMLRRVPALRRAYNRFGLNLQVRAHRRRYLRAAQARRGGQVIERHTPRRARARRPKEERWGARIDKAVSGFAYRRLMTLHKPLMFCDWYWRTYRRLRQDHFDVFHAHDLNTMPVATLLARRQKARLVFDAHELYAEVSTLSPRESRMWHRIESRSIQRASAVVTVCESIAEELVRRHGIEKPEILLNCPPAAPLPVLEPGTNPLRERAELPLDGEPVVLYQGGFSKHRGLPELIRAAHSFERGTLVLMGWGSIEEELREQIRREGLVGKVRIVAPATREELPVFTAGADIGVIPYQPIGMNNTFTTPNKLFEYISAGLPIAGTRLPELVRFVEGHRIGVTFDAERPTDMAAAINQILVDDDLRAEMRRRALEVRERYVWEVQSRTLLDLYERVAPVSAR